MSNETYAKLIGLLVENNARYRLIEHEREGRTELVSAMRGNELREAANCIVLMVKIGKKGTRFVLAVFPANRRVDLEAVKTLFHGTYVSFASPDKAEELAGSVLGTVLPFSFREDLELIVDPSLLDNKEIYFNAARLDQSVVLDSKDYARIARPRFESIVEGSQEKAQPHELKEVNDLHKLRHSLAHVLAQAVLKLWPDAKISIGPPIDYGCYYDFLFSKPISDADFPNIEKEMKKIIHEGQTFRRDELSTADAKKYWKKLKQPFKVELIEDLEKNEKVKTVTHYTNIGPKGEETFVDLCRGGHVESLKEIPVDGFKILSLAGAYWRGDEKREQLTRMYVAAFQTKEELSAHLHMLEEAKKRDHRKLGKELEIFTFSDEVGPGLPLWLPNGTVICEELEKLAKEKEAACGYQRVATPHITKGKLYETSGHLPYYKASMFPPMDVDGESYYVKPMNCPHHHMIYASRPRSYRELPLRLAEYGHCYRFEDSGALFGLMRVRSLTMNDAHIYCTEDQVKEEFLAVMRLHKEYYDLFGIKEYFMRLSLHDKEGLGKKYVNAPRLWEKTEAIVREAMQESGIPFEEAKGEGAFYGPKIDFQIKSAIGREFTASTNQLDFAVPPRFKLEYTADDGSKKTPLCIHRAPLGTHERFVGFLLEHFGGLFPLWLAPVQIGILPVAAPHEDYAVKVSLVLRAQDVRYRIFDASESLGKRIREGELQKIPYLLVLGDREREENTVAVRCLSTKKQYTLPFDAFLKCVQQDIRTRALSSV